jgi:hypothetical protein
MKNNSHEYTNKYSFFLRVFVAISSYLRNLFIEIDRVLAKHYGFTDEELDFIINYDIKYRMGRELGGDVEGEE